MCLECRYPPPHKQAEEIENLNAEVVHTPAGEGDVWGFRDLDTGQEVYTLEKWTAYKKQSTTSKKKTYLLK